MSARPAALITGEVSPYRREPFRLLARAEDVEVIAWAHDGDVPDGLTVHRVSQARAARLAASGRYRAVICGLGGRVALPGAYLGARRARVPFVLWATMWSHPRTPAHALSLLPTRWLYRHADAVATYGPHVTRYVERWRGARGLVFEAPQAVDAREFGRAVPDAERQGWRERAGAASGARFLALFAGRLEREKGVEQLLEAWAESGLAAQGGVLAFAGEGPLRGAVEAAGAVALGRVPRGRLPGLYAAADALVLPSIRTATFTEPWGFVLNEAMHQGTPVIATDAVGAVAGGLVRDGRNGLVTPERDPHALAARLRALAANPDLRARLGAAALDDVAQYTPEAWVEGMRAALRAVSAGRPDPSYPSATPL
ncbi:MAG TPA: glycosyltransferase family 4 protein [Thermoleophilaceae bacterium]|jgi:glycosyltransferase involved in cell wall biosynthesis